MKEDHKIRDVSLSRSDIERIAKRLFALKNWVEEFGKPIYYLRQPGSAIKVLSNRNVADEWEIIQHGFRWYVFLSSDKIGSENESRIKVSPATVEKIRQTDFSVEGAQRKLARQLGIHESHLSRIRRGLRRTENVAGKTLSKKDKKRLFVSRADVQEFFEGMLTVKDFFDRFGKEYKIKGTWDVYTMCASQKKLRLPSGWHSIRVGESWLIYYSQETT